MKRFLTFLSLLLLVNPLLAQQHKIDSLLKLIDHDKEDTQKVVHLFILADVYRKKQDSLKMLELGNQILSLSVKLQYKRGEAEGYMLKGWGHWVDKNTSTVVENFLKALPIYEDLHDTLQLGKVTGNIGLYYMDISNYQKAIEYYNKSLKFARISGNKDDIAVTATDLGIVEINQGDYPDALKHYLLALKMDQESGDSIGVSMDYNAVGSVYSALKDFSNAFHYERTSMLLALHVNDSNTYARAIENIGDLYMNKKMYDSALHYELLSLYLQKKRNVKENISVSMSGLGIIYAALKNYPAALAYFDSSFNVAAEMNDKANMARALSDMGSIYVNLKQYNKAEKYLKEGIILADTIQSYQLLTDLYGTLSDLYYETGKWQKAYETFVKASAAKDSLVNADKSKEIGKIEAKADYDKQLVIQQAEEGKKEALAAAESKKQKIIIYFSIVIVTVIALIALVVFRSLWITRKQKALIEEQKNEVEAQKNLAERQKNIVVQQKAIVEEKNKEITDSITYAKRLQDAILPPMAAIKKYFPESFVLYKPKDIVAGDFYWMEASSQSNTVFVAACDCTGHGVPGAMVSVVCSNALNRAVKEFHLTEPGKILDKTRELVLETFGKSEGNIQDGMDISLASITKIQGGVTTVNWAGAYNSLWYIQPSKKQNNIEIIEITGNKQPIGKTDNPQSFTTHTITLSTSGTFYLFTDGYADQFGGEKGKKFKYKQLQQLLLAKSNLSMSEQKSALEQTFEEWKGDLEQTDDVCLIGIRV